MSIGENIKNIRLQQNLTQAELARKLQVDQSLICQFERGTKAPSLPLSKEIAEALHCEISDLVG
ncbi:MAG: helix-turn-helix transcriptional regulator [Clostridiales bacterium]|nr:helix-turn-helix transcriptional regulator [Clostridiales bacterium]